MEAQVNIPRLLTQPQEDLQVDLKTNNTKNHQKIELYGSLTTKDLKKPPSSRQVGGARVEMGRKVRSLSVVQIGDGGRMGGPTFTCGG